jgi:cytochrome b
VRELSIREIKVWDIAVRLFHWSLAAMFVLAYVSGEEWEKVHVIAGYMIGVLIVFRVLWGFIGTRHARFSDFVRSPATVREYLGQMLRFRAPRYVGHNPAGGAMVIALLTALAITVITGIALHGAQDFAGPLAGVLRGELASDLLEGSHELAANLSVFLILLHVAGVLFSSLEHGENLIRAMITGRKKEELV